MARPAAIPAALLVEDMDFYPRATIDSSHVRGMAAALKAGHEMPPVVADRASRRLVDGWHRRRAALQAFGSNAKVEVFFHDYANDAELFEEAVALNATHGRRLTPWDHTRIAVRAEELEIPVKTIAVMVNRDEDYIKTRMVNVARKPGNGQQVALKRTMRKFAGTVLTDVQERANEGSDGWSAAFHAHQLIMLIEAEAMGELTEEFAETLSRLRDLIDGLI